MYKLFKLKFLTPVHFGTNRPGFEDIDNVLHSDTLFSAIVNTWMRFYPEDLMKFFPENSENEINFSYFKLSSAFPFYEDLLFFPKPYIKPNFVNDDTDPRTVKKWKKVEFVDEDIFRKILNNETIDFQGDEGIIDQKFLTIKKVKNNGKVYSTFDVPRIVKDRISQQTTPFTFTRMEFDEKAGLFFLADFQNNEWEKKFRTILNLLGDYGIGGDRTIGHGQFEVSIIKDFETENMEQTDAFVNLSLFHPGKEEISTILQKSSYQLIERKGWIYSGKSKPLRRKSVRMFREGSVFSGAFGYYGNVVKVLEKNPALKLEHDVFRYGIALTLPARIGGENAT